MRQAIGLFVVCVLAVGAADLTFRSTLLRTVSPVITSPADGAIVTAPVTVRWEGQQPMLATVSGSGFRRDLGARYSPFEIAADDLPRPGQYVLEIRSPALGWLIRTERRFRVQPTAEPVPPPAPPETTAARAETEEALSRLRSERDRIEAEKRALLAEHAHLQTENRDMASELDELREAQEQADRRLASIEAQQAELAEAHQLALQENQILRSRLASIPNCTTWGYLSYPRPQTVPPTRRVVLVSNGRGQVFRDEAECAATRRADPTAASPCVCVGSVWDHLQ